MTTLSKKTFDPETYEPAHPAHELTAAKFAPLTARPNSQDAREACRSLLDDLSIRMGGKITRKQREAFGALVADLVERDPDDLGGWLYRSMNPAAFTGELIGHRPFTKAYSALADDLIEEVRGNRVWGQSEISRSGRLPVWQRATRFRANDRFRSWFAQRGITHKTWGEHFARSVSPPVAAKANRSVVLRTGKPPRHFRVSKGYPIPLDLSDPRVVELIGRMDRINAYLAETEVNPCGQVVLRRIFAHGDNPQHGWKHGGRLYAVGAAPYQTMKPQQRADITINGKPTCELDIEASHLTILAGLGHVPRFQGDPYIIESLPREVVKRWVNMTLSHGKRHARWPKAAVDDFLKKKGIDLRSEYPLERTGDTILRHLPILGNADGQAVAIGWGELQFRESEVILRTMEVLALEHDVAALPVHDSLIVSVEAKGLATAVLGNTFRDAFGIEPKID